MAASFLRHGIFQTSAGPTRNKMRDPRLREQRSGRSSTLLNVRNLSLLLASAAIIIVLYSCWSVSRIGIDGQVAGRSRTARTHTTPGGRRQGLEKHVPKARAKDTVPVQPKKPMLNLPLWWFSPFLDGSSFGKEATELVMSMVNTGFVDTSNARIGLLQMSCDDKMQGVHDPAVHSTLLDMHKKTAMTTPGVVVCHNMPPFFGKPRSAWRSCEPCPPPGYNAAYTIARAMSETNRIPQDYAQACDSLDEVWVPTDFSKTALIASGVQPHKVHVVPPTINTTVLDPTRYPEPLTPSEMEQMGVTKIFGMSESALDQEHIFKFVSVFKWEQRKGWDVLLSSYLSEFTFKDHVALYIVTKPFESDAGSIREQIQTWAAQHVPSNKMTRLPRLFVVDKHLSSRQYAHLLGSMDAFVLPTRGEGFGLPMVEAMCMGLPVLATNYSGVTAYLDDKVGYPIRYLEVPVPDSVKEKWYIGSRWAEPDDEHLRTSMRAAASDREAAKKMGLVARERVLDRYSPEAVSLRLLQEFKRIERVVQGKQLNL